MPKFRHRWTCKQKLRIVNEAEGFTLQEASNQFSISTSSLSLWRTNKQLLQERVDGVNKENENLPCRLKGAGRPPSIGERTAAELMQYLDEERENIRKVDITGMVIKLRQLDPYFDGIVDNSNGCLAVRGKVHKCIWRVLRKHNVSLRKVTHQAQNTRVNQSMIDGFGTYIEEKMKMLLVRHDCLANFDETNIYFSPATRDTLDRRGSKTVTVKIATSSQRCTAMLGVTGDGHPFQPFVVFAGVHRETGQNFKLFKAIQTEQNRVQNEREQPPPAFFKKYPFRCVYAVQEKAWMDSVLMLQWVECVWKPWAIVKNCPTMLILDEFSGHMTAEVRHAIASCGTHLEFIPGGYTSKLQVMDVGFNKPFKDPIRHQFDNWLRAQPNCTGKPKKYDVAAWIQNSWEDLSFGRIATNTWRRIGIPQPIPVVDDEPELPANEHMFIETNEEEDIIGVVVDIPEQEVLDDWYYDDTNGAGVDRVVVPIVNNNN